MLTKKMVAGDEWGIEFGVDIPLEHYEGVEERGGIKGCEGCGWRKRGKKRNGKRFGGLARELGALSLSGAVLPMVP